MNMSIRLAAIFLTLLAVHATAAEPEVWGDGARLKVTGTLDKVADDHIVILSPSGRRVRIEFGELSRECLVRVVRHLNAPKVETPEPGKPETTPDKEKEVVALEEVWKWADAYDLDTGTQLQREIKRKEMVKDLKKRLDSVLCRVRFEVADVYGDGPFSAKGRFIGRKIDEDVIDKRRLVGVIKLSVPNPEKLNTGDVVVITGEVDAFIDSLFGDVNIYDTLLISYVSPNHTDSKYKMAFLKWTQIVEKR